MLLQGMENPILLLELKKVEKKNFGMNEIFPQPYISIKLRNYSINRLYVRFCKIPNSCAKIPIFFVSTFPQV